jgi:pimeloyl-ACP methyl ester carboxylesterase
VETVVAAQWTRVLGRPPSGDQATFFDDGATSLSAAQLAVALSDAFGAPVPLPAIFDGGTLHGIAECIRLGPSRERQRIYGLKESGSGAPIVLLPGAAGDLPGLERFSHECFDRPVHGLDMRGLLPHEGPPARTVDGVVADYARILDDSSLPRVVHLVGHCLGGIHAYELARVLRLRGWTVLDVTLVSSSLFVPFLTYEEGVRSRVRVVAGYNDLALTDEGQQTSDYLFAALQGRNINLLDSTLEEFAARIEVHGAAVYGAARYSPAPLDGPVTLIDPPDRNDPEEVALARPGVRDWTQIGLANLRVVHVPVPHDMIPVDLATMMRIEALLKQTDPA